MAAQAYHYQHIWQQFVRKGSISQDDVLPPALLQSWRRCSLRRLDPHTTQEKPSDVFVETMDTVRYPPTLMESVRPAMEDLHQFAEGSACVVVFADSNAVIVDLVGDQSICQEFEPLGLSIGASWSEERQGTNALALAVSESFPVQLTGAMHYCAALHPLYTSAAPVHDLLGQSRGVLAIIGRCEDAHPHTLGMVTAAAQAISNQLQTQVWLTNANDLLSELKTILQSLPEGVLLIRRDGVISQMNTPAGKMLGLIPEQVAGRYLSDVLPLPRTLITALATEQMFSDEEIVFDTSRGQVTCLCTLKPLTIPSHAIAYERLGSKDIVAAAEAFILEPTTTDGFIILLRSIERAQKLARRMLGGHARLTFDNVVGESPRVKEALRLARIASTTNSTVLLHGETGSGKEIFSQSIHNSSARAEGPFVAINCAAIPRELITTELFGYEGGAFTGADRQGRAGKFEQAHEGTLFLDEIGDMPLDLQASLLRAIETHTIVRIGGQRAISVDVRIIVATHKDLREEVRRGAFRSDLYYRLHVLSIHLPSLRERSEDIPLLIYHFLQRQSRIRGRSLTITSAAVEALQSYNWPGNVRELENMLERVSYLIPQSTITLNDLPIDVLQTPPRAMTMESQSPQQPAGSSAEVSGGVLKESSINAEMQAILAAYHASDRQMARTAALLGINRTTLWRKMLKYGLIEGKKRKER
jgi:transcriptional regulator of acetoin/glycerol metabolism